MSIENKHHKDVDDSGTPNDVKKGELDSKENDEKKNDGNKSEHLQDGVNLDNNKNIGNSEGTEQEKKNVKTDDEIKEVGTGSKKNVDIKNGGNKSEHLQDGVNLDNNKNIGNSEGTEQEKKNVKTDDEIKKSNIGNAKQLENGTDGNISSGNGGNLAENTKNAYKSDPNLKKPAHYAVNRAISDDEIKKIQEIPKGERPEPGSYLSPDYIQDHLDKFNNGGSYLMPMSTYEALYVNKDSEALKPSLGYDDGTQYMMPKEEMDKIIQLTRGDIDKVMDALGIDQPEQRAAYDKGFVRVDIPNPKNYDLRMPSGNEAGVGPEWIPGGFTSGWVPEAVTNKNIPFSEAIFSKYYRIGDN